jgi:ubiquinone/menaquinone biosynthesis C-methylase UbiE
MRVLYLVLSVCLCCSPGLRAQAAACSSSAKESAQAKRERDLKMPEIIKSLALKQGSKVADVGAGDGDYDVAMSHAVGAEGRVYGEDISSGAIKRLHQRVDEDHLGNVDVIEGVADDPKLPANLDGVLMVITYHEIADHEKMLNRVL